MPDVLHPARTTGGIFDQLDTEWAALCADTAVQATVTDWLVTDQLAAGIAAVTDSSVRALGPSRLLTVLRAHGDRLTDALADAVLRALLRRAAGRDRSATLAGRIIVQAMIPAAVRMARGQVRPFGGRSFDYVGHTAVAALYEVACSGRIHTRPGRPAANLALETLRHFLAQLAAEREELGEDLAVAEDLPDPLPGPAEIAGARAVRAAATAAGLESAGALLEGEPSRSRLEVLGLVLEAMESGGLSPGDGRLITSYYAAGSVSDAKAAAYAGTSVVAWRRRRSRAVAALKSSLQPAA
ncbi:hypothetical protein OTB20_33360 [Streptomyces sp. H27-H1]|uniref:hypothetical protein n=1 Tax=Streptomyces sp. H27-H1 TaxID=2996461 RepID=UPI002271699E|nr:hypothetical protein [Streptomyces sp. H27-H1]MCY0930997.1 hypothetical protein [Streptomyces sp. H27-H1]